MACSSQSLISANTCVFPSKRILRKPQRIVKWNTRLFTVNASTGSEESDCNAEECAPDKEVGKVSMEWLAEERTKVVGTYPPRKRGWTGYVEKDTAGQTNIYSVEPSVYVAESAISSGSAGTSAEGAENTAAIAAGLALLSVAAASSILLQVGKNQPQVQSIGIDYSGPPLSYYIDKFKPVDVVEASAPPESRTSPNLEATVPPESSSYSTIEASVPPEPQVPSSAQS
ncbi:protein MAINTENANCE OF PSII UNDER HIGH LIGHT 1 [Cocos nucifera]|uniref:Protein MAINTENANCE OF PSII UNDER HIGH LIGHT 1 n=1 Tax=Cocos nucifera TaxID=13894 RepID=A0A8K0IWY6_COCNU|nr:protein MAINTENANCE OF PSII UNDER HIGH LIGHT 1 [Cocos nucifera]